MTLREVVAKKTNLVLIAFTAFLWVFSFPVAWKGELISNAWVNALCVSLFMLPLLKLNDGLRAGAAFRLTYFIAFIAYYFIL